MCGRPVGRPLVCGATYRAPFGTCLDAPAPCLLRARTCGRGHGGADMGVRGGGVRRFRAWASKAAPAVNGFGGSRGSTDHRAWSALAGPGGALRPWNRSGLPPHAADTRSHVAAGAVSGSTR